MSRFFSASARSMFVLCAMVSQGGTAQVSAPMTLRAALEQTLAHNPQLQGFEYRTRAQDARIATAGLRPPWEVRAELENLAGTGDLEGIDATEATFSLSHVIELGDKRDRRIEAAQAAHDVLQIERRAAQLDVVAEMTRRFTHVASDQEQLKLTERATALAQTTLEAAQRRVESARAPDVELHRARITLARARIEQEHAEHELLAARRKLAAMWGATEDRFGAVVADLYQLPAVPAFERIAEAIPESADFLRFASEARLRDAELRVAEARSRADLSVSAGVRHLQTADDQAFVLGFSLPLGAKSRAQGPVAEARALRNLTDAEQEAHRVRVLAQIFETYQELKHAVTEASVLRETVAPEMESALEASEYAFERGRYSYLEWTETQRELIAVQRALIEASANAHLLQIEIERLTATHEPR